MPVIFLFAVTSLHPQEVLVDVGFIVLAIVVVSNQIHNNQAEGDDDIDEKEMERRQKKENTAKLSANEMIESGSRRRKGADQVGRRRRR